jgi:hypothetical protein
VEFDATLIIRLSQSGPRYTSYPTADRFSADFGFRDYKQAVSHVRSRGGHHPLSLYVHIPFCDTVCYYCGCNKIVTKNKEKAAIYLEYLKKEIAMQGKLFAGINQIEQLHFGGGTPTYLSDDQMQDLMEHIRLKNSTLSKTTWKQSPTNANNKRLQLWSSQVHNLNNSFRLKYNGSERSFNFIPSHIKRFEIAINPIDELAICYGACIFNVNALVAKYRQLL